MCGKVKRRGDDEIKGYKSEREREREREWRRREDRRTQSEPPTSVLLPFCLSPARRPESRRNRAGLFLVRCDKVEGEERQRVRVRLLAAMDVEEYRDSRIIMGSKHGNFRRFLPAKFDSSDVHLAFDDLDGDDDFGASLPCPYCYVDIEIRSLCTHLREEHCFDLKNAVCPLCAANLGRDMTGHFMLQHSHLIKRRKPKKSGFWANGSAVMGRDLQELTSFLGIRPNGNGKHAPAPDHAPDPPLSPFMSDVSLQIEKVGQGANLNSPTGSASTTSDNNSKMVSENEAQDSQEKIQRAELVQQLLLSTIF